MARYPLPPIDTSMPSLPSFCQNSPLASRCDFLPGLVVRDQIGQQFPGRAIVADHQAARVDRVRGPEAVFPRLAALAEPEDGVVVQVARVAQPAAFVEMVAGGAVDRIVLAAPGHGRQELRHDEPIGRLLDMLAVGPPAEVVDLLEILVGALEKRHVRAIQFQAAALGMWLTTVSRSFWLKLST